MKKIIFIIIVALLLLWWWIMYYLLYMKPQDLPDADKDSPDTNTETVVPKTDNDTVSTGDMPIKDDENDDVSAVSGDVSLGNQADIEEVDMDLPDF